MAYVDVALTKDRRLRKHDDASFTEGPKPLTSFRRWSDSPIQRQPLPNAMRSPLGEAMQAWSHANESTVSLKSCARESPLQSFVRAREPIPRSP